MHRLYTDLLTGYVLEHISSNAIQLPHSTAPIVTENIRTIISTANHLSFIMLWVCLELI